MADNAAWKAERPGQQTIARADLVSALLIPAALISIIGFVESVSVAQTLAARKRQRIDPDQELLGLGAANIGAAFTGGLPVTGWKKLGGKVSSLPAAARGKVWVAGFMFTTCPSVCPKISRAMLDLQQRYARNGVEVELVSFSVDPETDTPAVLKRYAENLGADQNHWRFVTGDRAAMEALVVGGFKTAMRAMGLISTNTMARPQRSLNAEESARVEAIIRQLDPLDRRPAQDETRVIRLKSASAPNTNFSTWKL